MNKPFGLYLILTNPAVGYETCTKAAVDCGVRFLQLRMKNVPKEEILKTAAALRRITRGTETSFIINDDIEIAIESGADGLHLGQDDLSISEARTRWNNPKKMIGLSTHSLKQAMAAEKLKADYIGIGPVYPTKTKADADPALGPAMTGKIATSAAIPSVAIGGIDEHNLPELLDTGVVNFCVVSAVNQSENPTAAIRKLQEIWKSHFF